MAVASIHEVDLFAEAMAARAQLVRDGALPERREFMRRAGLTRQVIHQRLTNGSLFTVDGLNGEIYFPAFFLDASLDGRMVTRVCRALKALPGASRWDFFRSPRYSLGGLTPLAVLGSSSPGRTPGERDTRDQVEKVSLSRVLRAAAAYANE